MLFTEHITNFLISTMSRGLKIELGHTRQTYSALHPHLVDEPSSIRLVRALLRGRPVEGALVQRVVLLLLLRVGRAMRSRLMLLPPCTAPRPQELARKQRTRLSFLREGFAAQALQAHGGETCLGGLPRDAAAAAAAAHVGPPHRGPSCQCLHWHGLQQHNSSGVLCSPNPCDMPCWRSGRPWRLGSHCRCVSNAKVAQAIACSSVCFLRQHEGSEAGAWQSQDSWPVLTAWLLLGARLASPAAHHVLRLVGRCGRPAVPERVHHVPHLQQPC